MSSGRIGRPSLPEAQRRSERVTVSLDAEAHERLIRDAAASGERLNSHAARRVTEGLAALAVLPGPTGDLAALRDAADALNVAVRALNTASRYGAPPALDAPALRTALETLSREAQSVADGPWGSS